MRSSLVAALLAAAVFTVPAAAQSFIAPGDLDHVLGASLALAVEAADRLDAVHPDAGGVISAAELRAAQRRAFRAALAANRADSYLRLYAIHLGEHREAIEQPPPVWTELSGALQEVPDLVERLLDAPAEDLSMHPFDVAASRAEFRALAGRLRVVTEAIGEMPGRYDD
jgi:hypothetical protein